MTHQISLPTRYDVPPVPEGAVQRSRLIQKINTGIKQRLVLVSAPAGFGKSILVSQWVAQTQLPVVWINLDSDDNHINGFYYSILTAIIPLLDPPEELKQTWELALSSMQVEDVYLQVMDNLSRQSLDLALVLDDYHRIESNGIQESVCYWLDHMPSRLHMVIIARSDPDVPMHCLRAKGQVLEIRADELEFNYEEIDALFRTTYNFPLSESEIESLARRSEGWVACLQLAALSMQKLGPGEIGNFINAFASSNRHVWDYLIEEVFNQQPEPVRDFMLRTSILSRFNASLCDDVLGVADSRAMLDHLDRSNLLVPLDQRRHWYRYSSMNAEFLHEYLEQQAGMQGLRELHSKASRWYERMGILPDAVNHAFGAQELERAMLLLNQINESVDWKKHFTWQYHFLELPDEVLESEPEACLHCVWTFIYSGNLEGYERPLQIAERVWQASRNEPMLGRVYHIQALMCRYRGDNRQAIQFAEKSLASLAKDDLTAIAGVENVLGAAYLHTGRIKAAEEILLKARGEFQQMGDFYSAGVATATLARVYKAAGQLHKAEEIHQQVIQFTDPKLYDQVLAADIFLGGIYYEWNKFDLAEKYLQHGIQSGSANNKGRYWPLAYLTLASIWWEQGRHTQAEEAWEKALSNAARLGNQSIARKVKAHQARCAIRIGDLERAQRWLEEADALLEEEMPDYRRYYEWVTLVRLQIAQAQKLQNPGLLARTLKILDKLLVEAVENNRENDAIEIGVLQAMAFWQQGDRRRALDAISTALLWAGPENYVRVFIDEKEPVAQLLQWAVRSKLQPEYSRILLGEYNQLPLLLPVQTTLDLSVSPLSNREAEILKYLSEGKSTQEIAEKLVLSQFTVRTHIKNLFEKLEVHSRLQAVEQARARNLL